MRILDGMQPRRPAGARRRGAARGFSMVELLVTLLILTIVLVGLAALQLQVMRGVTSSRRSDEATRLGQAVIERYIATAPTLWGADTAPAWFRQLQTDGASQMTNVDVTGQGFNTGPFTVEAMIETLLDTSRLVTVRVSWADAVTGAATPLPAYVVLTTRRAP